MALYFNLLWTSLSILGARNKVNDHGYECVWEELIELF